MKRALSLCISLTMAMTALAACGSDAAPGDGPVSAEANATVAESTEPSPQETVTTTVQTTAVPETTTTAETEPPAVESISQDNSIAWLNYLAMLSQEINSSQNSRMFLEEAYSALVNNTDPSNVSEITEAHLMGLLDTIEEYRMISFKRERLRYIYEQNKAGALRAAIPDPRELVGTISGNAVPVLNIGGMIQAVVGMAVDAYPSYVSEKNDLDMGYLKDGWELDSEAEKAIHESRKQAFAYMIDIVREEDLPGELALNESAVEKFVECRNNTNVHQQIQFLESNAATYEAFGSYWLLLAKCCYYDGQYEKCLECAERYEALGADIFRKDRELAQTLPVVIASASEVMSGFDYELYAVRHLELLTENTDPEDWALRFFAAEVYLDLYSRTGNEEYLRSGYDLALDNVNQLAAEQDELNRIYLADVEEVQAETTAAKEEKKLIKDYNKSLKDKRKTELPEIYEPLAMNCELLFSAAEKLDLTQAEKDRVDGILAGGSDPVFLTKPIRTLFSFSKPRIVADAEFEKNKLTLPAACLSEGARVTVTVTDGDESTVYNDWKLDKVDRPGSSFSAFKAIYTSSEIKNYAWTENSRVRVEIQNGSYAGSEPYVIEFRVLYYEKNRFLGDSVEFEQLVS